MTTKTKLHFARFEFKYILPNPVRAELESELGYFLEFERFNEHPENENLIPVLNETATLYPEPGTSNVPPGLGFKSTVVWFYYKDMEGIQRFYEEVMGFDLFVDQGKELGLAAGVEGFGR